MYYLHQLTCILVNLERLADLGIVIEMNFLAISHVKHFIVSELVVGSGGLTPLIAIAVPPINSLSAFKKISNPAPFY